MRRIAATGLPAITAAVALTAVATSALTDEHNFAALLETAKRAYPGDLCWWERVEEDISQIAAHEIGFRYSYEDEDGPERTVTVYEMPCFYGAYNFGTIWFIENEFDGLRPLHFAEPVVDVKYAGDGETDIESLRITGFRSTPTVVNSSYDEASRTISGFAKWRGLGDASSTGVWTFSEGEFVLTRFEIDATYDDEINPIVVYLAAQN